MSLPHGQIKPLSLVIVMNDLAVKSIADTLMVERRNVAASAFAVLNDEFLIYCNDAPGREVLAVSVVRFQKFRRPQLLPIPKHQESGRPCLRAKHGPISEACSLELTSNNTLSIGDLAA